MSGSDYIPTIGIETHVQLKTKTKLFSAVGNDARDAKPNTLISHICVGLPGALPVLNQSAIELSARAALALNTQPQKFSRFERKHYFYPDLPKGYQITQLEDPIIKGGYIDVPVGDELKRVNIERANLEEDAGKNTHPAGADYSLVDLNRAGTPLLEIVSQPDLHSPAEAKAYARELWLAMKYAGVTDGDLYQGQVRFDVNVSVSNEAGKLGTRSEIKNLNSFRSVEGAVTYEIKRQIERLQRGEKIVQETRGWDEAKQRSIAQRSKEEAEDYRYMPEPDVPPVELDDAFTDQIEAELPLLTAAIRKILAQIGLETKVIEDILDNQAVCQKVILADSSGAPAENVRRLAFDCLEEPDSVSIDLKEHLKLAELLRTKAINSSSAKEILKAKLASPAKSIEELSAGKSQLSGEEEIEKFVDEVLAQNPKAADDVKRGEAKAIGFLVGQVMAASHGQANPQVAQNIIKKKLGM